MMALVQKRIDLFGGDRPGCAFAAVVVSVDRFQDEVFNASLVALCHSIVRGNLRSVHTCLRDVKTLLS